MFLHHNFTILFYLKYEIEIESSITIINILFYFTFILWKNKLSFFNT